MGRKKGYAPRTILGAIARLAVRRMEQWAEEGKDPADVQRVREIYGQVQRELQALEAGAYQGAGE